MPEPTPSWLRRIDSILEGRWRQQPGMTTNAHIPQSSLSQHGPEHTTDSNSNNDRVGSSQSSITSGAIASGSKTLPGAEFRQDEEDAIERMEDEEAIGRLSFDERNEVSVTSHTLFTTSYRRKVCTCICRLDITTSRAVWCS